MVMLLNTKNLDAIVNEIKFGGAYSLLDDRVTDGCHVPSADSGVRTNVQTCPERRSEAWNGRHFPVDD